mgnify:CR=1 FL=1
MSVDQRKGILQMVASYETKAVVKQILLDITPFLDEKQRRILYGSAAAALGHGGIAFINEVTGAARNTISSGIEEISVVNSGQGVENDDPSRNL